MFCHISFDVMGKHTGLPLQMASEGQTYVFVQLSNPSFEENITSRNRRKLSHLTLIRFSQTDYQCFLKRSRFQPPKAQYAK